MRVLSVRGGGESGLAVRETLSGMARGLVFLGLLLVLASVLSGCAIKLVADYDEKTEQDVTALSAQVIGFYDQLLEKKSDERTYDAAAATYGDIETKMRVLLLRQQVRPLNQESEKQVGLMLEEWERVRALHKGKQSYPDVLIRTHRRNFERYFVAILRAEKARQFAADDAAKPKQ